MPPRLHCPADILPCIALLFDAGAPLDKAQSAQQQQQAQQALPQAPARLEHQGWESQAQAGLERQGQAQAGLESQLEPPRPTTPTCTAGLAWAAAQPAAAGPMGWCPGGSAPSGCQPWAATMRGICATIRQQVWGEGVQGGGGCQRGRLGGR